MRCLKNRRRIKNEPRLGESLVKVFSKATPTDLEKGVAAEDG